MNFPTCTSSSSPPPDVTIVVPLSSCLMYLLHHQCTISGIDQIFPSSSSSTYTCPEYFLQLKIFLSFVGPLAIYLSSHLRAYLSPDIINRQTRRWHDRSFCRLRARAERDKDDNAPATALPWKLYQLSQDRRRIWWPTPCYHAPMNPMSLFPVCSSFHPLCLTNPPPPHRHLIQTMMIICEESIFLGHIHKQ